MATSFGPDQAVAEAFLALRVSNPWVEDVGEVLAVTLHPWVFRTLTAGACVVAWRAGRTRAALVCGAALAAGSALGVGLKLLIARPRPVWGDPVAAEIDYSMPSGHALNAALGCGLLLVLGWPWLRRKGWHRRAVVVAVALVTVTALDRLVLGVHYPSDVTVGVALGAAIAFVADRFSPRLRGGLASGQSFGAAR
jgi:undecaprenyl-diphosphatase